ncbi:MAG: hypothetical protein JWM21_4242 [Acidobacteria bacterium]|nr:hypothetical protein [Acidobacteriota bacterium]
MRRRLRWSHFAALWFVIPGLLALAPAISAQAPCSIQMFMPDGSLPPRPIRFTLTRSDGRIETLFTDTKGKYQFTLDLIRESEYVVTVDSDGLTFDAASTSFRIMRNQPVYATVFLPAFRGKPKPPPAAIDVASLDTAVPAAARAAYDEGMKAVDSAQTEQAITHFKTAIKLYPQYLRAMNDLGVLYLQLRRLDEAAAIFEQAVKINTRFPFARLNLGVVLNLKGNFKKASEVLGTLYEENTTLRGLPVSYADALLGTGQIVKAEKVLRAALTGAAPDQSSQLDIHFKLGLVLNRQDRFADAVPELEKALTLDPKAANVHLLLGGSFLQLNRLPEAERELVRAYELGGGQVGSAQMFLGQLYLMQRNPSAALRAFEQYLRDVPAAPNSALIKAEIEKLKGAVNNE